MRKPLQEPHEFSKMIENGFAERQGHVRVFYDVRGRGEMIFRNTGDIDFLIESANKFFVGNESNKKFFLSEFGHTLGAWLERFLTKGFTTEMLQELRKALGSIRFYHALNPAIPSRGKPLPHWDYIADTEDFTDPKTLAAYAFSQQLTLDGFARLKRCRMKNCRKFFIGRPNTKWCSDACGNLYRVQTKRKRDKQ